MPATIEVERLPERARSGERAAVDALFMRLYDELRGLAHCRRRSSRPGATLGTTALVHEAYLKLAGGHRAPYHDRQHFFRVAASAMRQIVVDHARRRGAAKRGARPRRVALDTDSAAGDASDVRIAEVLALDAALERLAAVDERAVRVVELRFFGGLSVQETAAVLGVSAVTVKRDTRLARAFLARELGAQAG